VPIDGTPLPLASLPVVVAGPMLRRLTGTSVSVWVACTEPDPVTLVVTPRAGAPGPPTTVTATPAQVGRQLWLAVLTAPAPGGSFVAGETYEYDVTGPWPANRQIDWAALALPGATRPTFLAPPASVSDLIVFHTSCRKPHGGGRDGLALADDVIATRFDSPQPQPHLLLLSGDQIYSDEVGHPLAPRIARVATDLVGIDETDVFGALPPVGGRQAPTNSFGFTGGSGANQLWAYGEYMAMYLLAWSPVLWPDTLPAFPAGLSLDVDPGVTEESWNSDLDNLTRFRATLPAVRRVLANVASLMVFDDHEVTDDWNLDFPWVAAVYSNAPGRRLVTNGVLAYALCQHWGNVPGRFATAGSPEASLLAAVDGAGGLAASPAPTAAPLLGVPAGVPAEPPPAVALRDLSDPAAIRYDLTVDPTDGWPVRIVLLDERSAREFSRTDNQAARISRAALALQLPPPATSALLTLVVAAAPVLGSDLVENVIQPLFNLLPGGGEFADYESWSAVTANHQDLLERLAAHDPVVVLSGDVHYGFTARLTRLQGGATTHLAQLTASAAKNVEIKNAAISMLSELIMRLGLERVRDTAGYAALGAADRQKFTDPPPAGTSLPWDETVDVLLGRVVRDAQSQPTALPAAVADAYGLPAADWAYRVEPVDDAEASFGSAPAVPEPWPGWQPDNSLTMAQGLQRADLHRIGRMFAGLPQLAVVTFTSTGSDFTVHHELRCPVGDAADPVLHVLTTQVTLG
jgi:hypothetical protein